MATRTISVAGGNWDATAAWDEGVVPVDGDAVVARGGGDSGNVTVNVASACTSIVLTNYVNTLTFNANLTTKGATTFVSGMTIAGTAGTLILSSALTLTSAGKIIPNLTFTSGTNLTFTLADNARVSGLTTFGTAASFSVTLNGNTIRCDGDVTQANNFSGALNGTTTIQLGGTGTVSQTGTATWKNNTTINTSGTITFSGTFLYNTGTLTYTAGTVVTTGSTLNMSVGTTLNTFGMVWNNIITVTGVTYTLSSVLNWSGSLTNTGSGTLVWTGAGTLGSSTNTGSMTFSGASTLTLNTQLITTGTLTLGTSTLTVNGSAGFDVGTLIHSSVTSSKTRTYKFGNTYIVRTAFNNSGSTAAIRSIMVSDTPGSKVDFRVMPGATMDLQYEDPTDIDSSLGQTIFSARGTITTSNNWSNTLPVNVLSAGAFISPSKTY